MPDNVRRGRPQGKRHRDRTAACRELRLSRAVRVKRCGKSAPRTRQRGRHGKPHREQNRIGTMLLARAGRGLFRALSSGLVARGAQQCASQRNGRHVGGAISRPSKTRLTGRLAPHVFRQQRVIPGDRRETRDPCLNCSGMDPGSARLCRLSGMTPCWLALPGIKPPADRPGCCPASRSNTGRRCGPSGRGPRPRPCRRPAPRW